jgi:hypothetical protein
LGILLYLLVPLPSETFPLFALTFFEDCFFGSSVLALAEPFGWFLRPAAFLSLVLRFAAVPPSSSLFSSSLGLFLATASPFL